MAPNGPVHCHLRVCNPECTNKIHSLHVHCIQQYPFYLYSSLYHIIMFCSLPYITLTLIIFILYPQSGLRSLWFFKDPLAERDEAGTVHTVLIVLQIIPFHSFTFDITRLLILDSCQCAFSDI